MKTILNLITFTSVFQKQEVQAIRVAHRELFTALDESFDIRFILQSDLETFLKENHIQEQTVVFIATGGTEGMVVNAYDKLPKPLVLLADGKANSLAASLELSCWIRQQKDTCTLIHGDTEEILEELKKSNIPTKKLLEGDRIGVIGEPSDWLVASDVDYNVAKQNWGVEYINIPLSRIEKYYKEETGSDEEQINEFIKCAVACIEPTKKEIKKAFQLYLALKRVVLEERLTALTLQCFSLIPTTQTTGCLALSLLNDEGIIAGCEGDLQSIFTMLMVKRITGQDSFMANPSLIDRKNNRIILAHCTIGLRQTEKYAIRSHFESHSGVAIQGVLPISEVTIIKCGGKNLSEYAILTGKILENQNDPQKCRTQLLIQLDKESPVSYFLTNNIGNHHIILQGNYRQTLEQKLKRK